MAREQASEGLSLEQRRREVIDHLCQHFAADHLDPGELERRLDSAYSADSTAALGALVRGLPSLPAAYPSPVSIAEPGEVSDRGFAIAVMGSAQRKGNWIPPRRLITVAVMGGVDLDFREARLPASGVIDVHVLAFWGGVDIVVPPWVKVEVNGAAIVAGFDQAEGGTDTRPEGGPLLRVGGLAVMAGVDVSVRLPGESPRAARKRRRLERAARKSLPGDFH